MSERILFISCGDLGLRAAQRLLDGGNQVFALRRHPPAACNPAIQWLHADITQPQTLHSLPRGITRLAYLPAPSQHDLTTYRAVFLHGLRNVLAALDQSMLRRVVFVSSSAVYGAHADDWVTEDTPPNPPRFNGHVLLEAEQWLAAQPLSAVRLRLAGLYGPGRLQWIERLRTGQARAPRHPPHWANRIHSDDAAAATAHLLMLPEAKSVYLGCDDTPLPLYDLYAYLATLIGAPAPKEGPAPAGIGSKRLCNARLRNSGLALQWPDARAGYAALLRAP